MLIVRSPVRISFGGGGTDLPGYYEQYGGGVLSAAISKYFYTILSRRGDDKIQVISSDLRASETLRDIAQLDVKGSELGIPLAVLKELNCNVPLDLFLASEIPPGTGLGSSGSVCVGILKTLSSYLGLGYSRYQLADKAFHIARDVLGRPVGKQDEYAAAFGGLNYIVFDREGTTTVEPLNLEPALVRELQHKLMLFFTGASHNSWEILGEQEQAARRASVAPLSSLHIIHRLAGEMRDALRRGNLKEFGRLLDEGWQAKRQVSARISNTRIDRLYGLARERGALGGKITGAGGGGFLLLYCEPEYQAKVRDAFAHQGLREMIFEFDFQGARVLVNDPLLDGDSRCGLRWTFTSTHTVCEGISAEQATPSYCVT
jgi:D-glycero-alpha-D-manno-heptose-7-phosphate kinase